MKKRFFALIGVLFFMAAGSGLYAQQITKFGVVDTAKVYNAYFRNSAPVRNYEKKKAEFQEEINKYTDELQKLQLKKLTMTHRHSAFRLKFPKNLNFLLNIRTQRTLSLSLFRSHCRVPMLFIKNCMSPLQKLQKAAATV